MIRIKKRGRGKTRRWIRRRDKRGYLRTSSRNWGSKTQRYITKDMMRMSHADFQRILSYNEQGITRKQVLGGNKVISSKER